MSNNLDRRVPPLLCIALSACGAAGTSPHEMGADAHLSAAAVHERAAAEEERPRRAASLDWRRCIRQGRGLFCSSMLRDSRAERERETERHRAFAALHRAASQALRDAESSACQGLSGDDLDIPLLARSHDIESVEPIYRSPSSQRMTADDLLGASLTLGAAAGLTLERLQRLLDCEVARNAALGHDNPGVQFDPLAVEGATAIASSSRDRLSVGITAPDTDAAWEILERARALREGGRR